METMILLILFVWAIAAIRRVRLRREMERKYGPEWEKLFWYVRTHGRLP